MKLSRILLMLITLIAFVLLISSAAGIAWGMDTSAPNKTYIGLWKYCQGSECWTYNEATVKSWWFSIRVEMILAVMISFTGFIFACVMVAKDKLQSYILAVMLTPAAILVMVGASTWAYNINEPYVSAYSYLVGWVGFAVLLLAIIGALIDHGHWRKKKNDEDLLNET